MPSSLRKFTLVYGFVQVIRSYHGHLSGVYCLSLHPTLDILMTGGRDSVCRVRFLPFLFIFICHDVWTFFFYISDCSMLGIRDSLRAILLCAGVGHENQGTGVCVIRSWEHSLLCDYAGYGKISNNHLCMSKAVDCVCLVIYYTICSQVLPSLLFLIEKNEVLRALQSHEVSNKFVP